jgi:uncharacterized membrane protein YfcA
MVFGVPASELGWLALGIMAGGVVAGLLAGLFGIGGGAVIVPVLYEVFRLLDVPEDVRFQLCLGTSFAIIVPTTLRSYFTHRTKGAVLHDVMRQWALPSIVGVGIGTVIAAYAPPAVFKIAFILFMNVIAFKLLFARDSWRLGKELPGRAAMIAYGVMLGLAAALVGVSGGSLCTMILTLYGIPIHNAVATAAGFGAPVTIAATLGYMIAGWGHQAQLPPLSIGFVSLIGFALMAPISTYIASYGARLAHWLNRRTLEIAFGIFMLLVSLRFIISLL